jgi:hypothetical protein
MSEHFFRPMYLGTLGQSPMLGQGGPAEAIAISKAALAIGSLLARFLHIGSDPRKVPDTQVTEATQIALNELWYHVSGEQLPTNCTPGQCGNQHVAIFSSSAYPNVPNGPGGDPGVDIDQAIAAAQQILAAGVQRLLRPESASNPEFTSNNVLALLKNVRNARARMAAQATYSVQAPLPPAPPSAWGLPPGPAPRVASSLTPGILDQEFISGLPNKYLFGGILAALALSKVL